MAIYRLPPLSPTPSRTQPPMAPSSIIIIGSGVFGLSTAHELSHRPAFTTTTITLLDAHPFPTPHASSIDSSRIIRADYSDPLYAALAAEAQHHWRCADIGVGGVYTESGLVLVGDDCEYVAKSMRNVVALFGVEKIQPLSDAAAIRRACGTGGVTGASGYVNRVSGWADAEAGMRRLRARVEESGRVRFVVGEVVGLLGGGDGDGGVVEGVVLKDGTEMRAELTVLAAGAWSPGLVDLGGRAVPTGQVVGYVDLTEEEQRRYEGMPVILNFTTGLFVLPPRGRVLKVARHALGYTSACGPVTGRGIPQEGEEALRAAVAEMVPALAGRGLDRTRLCWYTDTPTGDFLVCHHPQRRGLFVCTGGSGHAYKFLPVLGREVVDVLEGVEGARFGERWRWRERVREVVTGDGSRGGAGQVVLEEAWGAASDGV
ncbi:FAD dependent oxidoreductase [Morchella conica CCBAS932]|uniref:FAD dependent oxidoreductase n=1 Tax=Morchella conica CCBAS932 TaxID=1392247 RepID=A0A3N4KQ65_9PEZI|nr:FAD dependent oxidoreductase [Morchella conica CCBAS932]